MSARLAGAEQERPPAEAPVADATGGSAAAAFGGEGGGEERGGGSSGGGESRGEDGYGEGTSVGGSGGRAGGAGGGGSGGVEGGGGGGDKTPQGGGERRQAEAPDVSAEDSGQVTLESTDGHFQPTPVSSAPVSVSVPVALVLPLSAMGCKAWSAQARAHTRVQGWFDVLRARAGARHWGGNFPKRPVHGSRKAVETRAQGQGEASSHGQDVRPR